MKTATETPLMREDRIAQAPLRDYMEYFAAKWSPVHPRENAEFQADFLRVIQAVHRDAMKPVEKMMAVGLAAMPPMVFPESK